MAYPEKQAGRYRLSMQFTKAPDYGIVQLYLDGQKLGDALDLYHDSVIPSGEVSFGHFQLAAGQHKLAVEVVGANDKAVKSYMFGLDYLKLEAVQ